MSTPKLTELKQTLADLKADYELMAANPALNIPGNIEAILADIAETEADIAKEEMKATEAPAKEAKEEKKEAKEEKKEAKTMDKKAAYNAVIGLAKRADVPARKKDQLQLALVIAAEEMGLTDKPSDTAPAGEDFFDRYQKNTEDSIKFIAALNLDEMGTMAALKKLDARLIKLVPDEEEREARSKPVAQRFLASKLNDVDLRDTAPKRTPREPKEKKTAEDVETRPVRFEQDEACKHLPWEEAGLPGIYTLKVKPGSEILDNGKVVATAMKGDVLVAFGADCGRLVFLENSDLSGLRRAFSQLENKNESLEDEVESLKDKLKAAKAGSDGKAAEKIAKLEADLEAAKEEAAEKVKEAKAAAKEATTKHHNEARAHRQTAQVANAASREIAEVQAGHKPAREARIVGPVMIEYNEMKKWGSDALFIVRNTDGKVVGSKLTAAEVKDKYEDDFKNKEEDFGLELYRHKLVNLSKASLRELDNADRPKENMSAAQREVVLDHIDKIRRLKGPGKEYLKAYGEKPERVLRVKGREGDDAKDVVIELRNGTYLEVDADGTSRKIAEPAPRSYRVVASEAALRPMFFENPHNAGPDGEVDVIEETLRMLGKELTRKELRQISGISNAVKIYRRSLFETANKIAKAEGIKYATALGKAFEVVNMPAED